MNRAQDLEQWREAMRMLAVPMFHTVYASADGHIGYVYNARLPLRGVAPGPQPVEDSGLSRTPALPWDRLPRVEDPAAGFVQNANSSPFRTSGGADDPRPGADPAWLGIETHLTNRARRLLERLAGPDPLTRAELEDIKRDVVYARDSAIARRAAELAAAGAPLGRPLLRAALAQLGAWDRSAGRGSRGAALALLSLAPDHRDRPRDEPLPAALDRVESVAQGLLRDFGRLDVPWGEVLRLRRGALDLPLDGGPDLVRAIYSRRGASGRRIGVAGDSYVVLVEWSPQGVVRSRSVHVFGSATARPDSPHYADQAPLFAAGRYKPLWLDQAELERNTEREYEPGELR